MAPELLNPPQFSLSNSNPSKESDIYSLAMTAYEVRSLHAILWSSLTSSLSNKILTDILPFGNARDGIIIFHAVTGDRPPRPPNSRWLKDEIWNMIITCWSEKREQRWDIHAVYNQLSVSGIPGVFVLPALPRSDDEDDQLRQSFRNHAKRARKNAIKKQAWEQK